MVTKHNNFFRFSCKSRESREQEAIVRRMKLVERLEIEGGEGCDGVCAAEGEIWGNLLDKITVAHEFILRRQNFVSNYYVRTRVLTIYSIIPVQYGKRISSRESSFLSFFFYRRKWPSTLCRKITVVTRYNFPVERCPEIFLPIM